MNAFEESIYDSVFDALMDYIGLLPKDTVKMIDFDRYKSMMQTAAELKDILAENGTEGQFDIDICDLFNSGSIKAELNELTVCDVPKFMSMISRADNFELYPKTNGKIQLNITFYSMLKVIQ